MSIESGHVGTNTPKVDEWRDGMVEQVSEYMDIIKDMDTEKALGADTALAEAFESIQNNSTDAVMDMLDVFALRHFGSFGYRRGVSRTHGRNFRLLPHAGIGCMPADALLG